jgi:hypothetical protein
MTDMLASIETMLAELPEAVDRRKLGDRLTQSLETLKTADTDIGRLTAILDLADLIGYGTTSPQAEIISELQDEARAVGVALMTAATAMDLSKAIDEYKGEFRQALRSADVGIRAHWGSFAAGKFQPVSMLGELLHRIGVEPKLAARMQDCGQRGLAIGTGGLLPDLVDLARSHLTELEAIQEERADTIGQGDVGRFINALADQRATLAMVTDEVRTWLEHNHALDRFSLSLS